MIAGMMRSGDQISRFNGNVRLLAFREDRDERGGVTRHEWASPAIERNPEPIYRRAFIPGCGPSPWIIDSHVDQDATFITKETVSK